MRTDPLEVYQKYVAVKLHFVDPRYDYVEQNGAIRARKSSLAKRRDKDFFEQVGRQVGADEILPFFVSNFVDSPDSWIGDLAQNDGMDVYSGWKSRIQKLEAEMSYDIDNTRDWMRTKGKPISDLVEQVDGGYPTLFKLYRRKMICPETFILIDRMSEMCDKIALSGRMRQDPIWQETTMNLHKYSRFMVTVTPERYGHLIPELLSEVGKSQ